ncbi:MAG: hypothetical protein QXN56_06955, partial [Candidatus Hadarchaeum sp.]
IVELRRPISLAPYPRLRFGIFCGGSGIVEITLNSQPSVTCEVSDEGRSWREVPLPVTEEFQHYVPRIARKVGTVDIYEVALLAGTPVKGLAETGEVMWPAAWFFRAGWSDPQSGVVVFEPLETPADEIFYGPRLPLPPGEYETELVFESDAPNGQDIGAWRVEDVTEAVPVVAGRKAVLSFAQDGQHLFSIRFRYFGGATVKLHRVILRRIGGGTHADAQS